MCVEITDRDHGKRLFLEECSENKTHPFRLQHFILTHYRDIQLYGKSDCLEVDGDYGFTYGRCHQEQGNQYFRYDPLNKHIFWGSKRNNICLDCDKDSRTVFLGSCDEYKESQKWVFGFTRNQMLTKWTSFGAKIMDEDEIHDLEKDNHHIQPNCEDDNKTHIPDVQKEKPWTKRTRKYLRKKKKTTLTPHYDINHEQKYHEIKQDQHYDQQHHGQQYHEQHHQNDQQNHGQQGQQHHDDHHNQNYDQQHHGQHHYEDHHNQHHEQQHNQNQNQNYQQHDNHNVPSHQEPYHAQQPAHQNQQAPPIVQDPKPTYQQQNNQEYHAPPVHNSELNQHQQYQNPPAPPAHQPETHHVPPTHQEAPVYHPVPQQNQPVPHPEANQVPVQAQQGNQQQYQQQHQDTRQAHPEHHEQQRYEQHHEEYHQPVHQEQHHIPGVPPSHQEPHHEQPQHHP